MAVLKGKAETWLTNHSSGRRDCVSVNSLPSGPPPLSSGVKLKTKGMPQFIHLTDERLLKRIEKAGIRTSNWGTKLRCVYATPVLKDFQVAHQWLRELKNKGIRTIGAVQFKISDGEEVLVGRYNEEPLLSPLRRQ